MFRYNVLAVLCLGLLASCGPDSRGQASPAGTTVTRAVTAMASNLVLGSNPLAFGNVGVDKQSTQPLSLTNKGTEPLTITRVSIGTSTRFTLASAPATPFSLAPGESQELSVTFSPIDEVVSTGTLTLTTDDPANPSVAVDLTGTGVSAPEWKLDRPSIFFGDVRLGSVSEKVPITVSNPGTSGVTLQNLSVQGPFAAFLPSGVTLPRVIPAAGSFTFEVVFKPATEGAATGSVSLISDTAPTLTVALSGTGTTAQVTTSTTLLDFGNQRVKATSAALPVVISNPGKAELEITELSVSNPAFAISMPLPLPSSSSPLRIGAGQQKVVAVTFTPTTVGLVEGKLHIISNAATPAPVVTLRGEGVDGQLSATPPVASFPSLEVGTGAPQSVTLSNTGGYPVTITNVLKPAETVFTVTGLAPGLVLKPGDQVHFNVTFAPVMRGYVSSSLTLESDSALNPSLRLALSGTGVGPAVDVLPTSLDFGKSNVGVSTTRDLSIKNVGEKDLYVSNISFAEAGVAGAALDFSVGGTVTFPLVVAPGQSTLVPLKFTPRAVGQRQARALLYTNDKTAEVGLQGEGSSPNLALSVLNLDFGNVVVASPSAARPLKLSNTGTGPLTLHAMTLGGADVTAFVLTKPALPLLLQPGATSDLWVSLRPDAERRFAAQLVVESNDPDAPSVAVPLSGSGVRQQIQLSESSLKFGQQLLQHGSRPRTVRVTNNSDTNATLTALTVAGAGASQFTLAPLALPLLLAPGQGQDVGVTFTPQAETEVSGTLKLTFSELPQPLEVALQGKGIPAVLSLKPSPLDFGGVRVGESKREQPLTLTNLSSDPIVLTAPEVVSQLGTPFSHDVAPLQGRTLEPGMSVILTVGYQSTAESLSETLLSFGTTQPHKPRAVDVQLKARALKQLLFVDQANLNFGRVEVDKPQAPKVVTITNRSAQSQWVVVKLKELESSPFTVETKALAEPIPAGGSVSIKVAFQPLAEGEVQNEVQVWLKGDTSAEVLIPVIGSGHIRAEGEGCSSGGSGVGSAGLLALLMWVGLGSRRRRRA